MAHRNTTERPNDRLDTRRPLGIRNGRLDGLRTELADMSAYYNEIDPYAAQWLRNLIAAGHIVPGVVDERSIEDVVPNELAGFTQCHFFAGIGVWSYALRQAGWPDDRPVWTGSCPCQPFSSAGQGGGFADERHLWPAFFHLIEQCRPPVVFGEQVASRDANPWIDLVQDDLEGLGYGVGAVPFPSAGVGAPHIRDRLYWVGHTGSARLEGHAGHGCAAGGQGSSRSVAAPSISGGLADANGTRHISSALARVHRRQEGPGPRDGEPERHGATGRLANASDQRQHGRRASETGHGRYASRVELERLCDAGGLANAILQQRSQGQSEVSDGHDSRGWQQGAAEASGLCIDSRRPGPTNGLWSAADWLLCRDGKWRPVEPGTFPLAHEAPARVGRLRAYGNAINAEAARVFIEAAMSCMP